MGELLNCSAGSDDVFEPQHHPDQLLSSDDRNIGNVRPSDIRHNTRIHTLVMLITRSLLSPDCKLSSDLHDLTLGISGTSESEGDPTEGDHDTWEGVEGEGEEGVWRWVSEVSPQWGALCWVCARPLADAGAQHVRVVALACHHVLHLRCLRAHLDRLRERGVSSRVRGKRECGAGSHEHTPILLLG